jgi:hypothetical protein
VVIDPTWKTVTLSVITWLVGAILKLNAIVKFRKYKGLHEGHRFILMAMEVYIAPWRDMDHLIRECAHLFHDKWSENDLSLYFCILFFKQHVSIAFHCALASIIERKITLISDACSKPPSTIRSHNLHPCDIRRDVDDIALYHKRD